MQKKTKSSDDISPLDRLMKILGMVDRKFWVSKGMDDSPLKSVDPTDTEFQDISASFRLTIPSASVDEIHRVENIMLHEGFSVLCHNVQKQVSASGIYANEPLVRLLFHGTNKSALDSVVHQGFLPMLAGTNVGAIYGNGTYFARDASYSDSYACSLPSGQKQVKSEGQPSLNLRLPCTVSCILHI